MHFVFDTKTRPRSVSRDNGKILVTGREMLKLCSCDSLTMHYSIVRENVNNRLILTLQNIMNFDTYSEYLTNFKQNIIMALLRKGKANSVDVSKFMKNQ